jgi:rSAM/selenodomain-associated transferase 1
VAEIPVCIFSKPPIPGRVKTRLTCYVGEIGAGQLASAMLRDVWSIVKSATGVIPVLAAAESGEFGIDMPRDRIWLQQPGDLGLRIEGILRRGLQGAPAAIALGADTPLLTPAHLREALAVLDSNDAVLGPSEDGGFYLLGVRHCPPGLLAEIAWSCEETCQKAVQRLQKHGMRVGWIGTLFDVDTIADLEKLRDQLEYLPSEIAPETRKWFDESYGQHHRSSAE